LRDVYDFSNVKYKMKNDNDKTFRLM
jgi:hypothetical protein